MMKSKGFWALLRAQFLGFWGINKLLNKKKNKKKSVIAPAVGSILVLLLLEALIVLYVWIYGSMFGTMGAGDYFIPFVFIILNLLVLFFSITSTLGSLFGFKDYEMVMSLPIKTWQIIIAKLLYIYLSNLLLSFAILVPSIIIVSQYVTFGFTFIFNTILSAVFLPLLPISIAVFVGTVLAFISSKFKHKSTVQLLGFLIFFVVCYAVGFFMGYAEDEGQITSVLNKFPLIEFVLTVLNNYLYTAIYIISSIIIFTLPCWFLAKNFKNINTKLLTHKTKSIKVNIESKTKSKFSALFIRERKRLFSCPMYAMNCLIGPIMSIVVSVTFVLLISEISNTGPITEVNNIFAFIILAFLGLLLTLTPTTASSISLEAKNLWELKSLPITTNEIFFSKLLLNTVLNVPVSLILAITFSILLQLELVFAIIFVICAVIIPFYGGVVGLITNVWFPYLTWENETAAVKRGISVLIAMLIDMVTIAIVGFVSYFLLKVSALLTLFAIMVIFALLTVLFLYLLVTNGVKRFNKIDV